MAHVDSNGSIVSIYMAPVPKYSVSFWFSPVLQDQNKTLDKEPPIYLFGIDGNS